MKTFEEKEKKLKNAISKLDNLNLNLENLSISVNDLETQKNQLKIEKEEIEKKYSNLMKEHKNLRIHIDKFNSENVEKINNQTKFSKKIDELNQETDNLLEELDKWQI